MNNNWYRLEFNPVEYVQNQNIKDLEEIIQTIFNDPRFQDDVMVLTPKNLDISNLVWIFPPRTVNLMLKKVLTSCGAKKCPQPNINDVSVNIGNEQDIHSFFLDEFK